jgi:hypothetical protein
MGLKLSILMLQLTQRDSSQLVSTIKQQIASMPDGQVEFLTEQDSGELTSGEKRNRLIKRSSGERIVFVDDDDMVSDDYVSSIVDACGKTEASVITFNLQMDLHVTRYKRIIHRTESWRFKIGVDNRNKGLMSANHLCAWKKSIAQMVAWDNMLGYADDQVWYKPLINCPYVDLTEYHVDRTLYCYICDMSKTANQTSARRDFAKKYVGQGLRCYWFSEQIVIEVGNSVHLQKMPPGLVRVRDSQNMVFCIPENTPHFYSCKIA